MRFKMLQNFYCRSHNRTIAMRTKSGEKMRKMLCLVLFLVAAELVATAATETCSRDSFFVGLSADLVMVQHQLRGSVAIVDDCTFKVTRFDMIAGTDVHWWGSLGDDFDNMTTGFPISSDKLNRTFQNDTLTVTLDGKYTWGDFKVLSVWDKFTGSDFGHISLEILGPDPPEVRPPAASGQDFETPTLAPFPSPAWAPSSRFPQSELPPSPQEAELAGQLQPMMFDNCVSLSKTFRVRWTLDLASGMLDLGLEGALTKSQYMGFGWSKASSSNQFMRGSDVVIAGMDEKGVPYAEDYFLGGYSECNWDFSNPSGVCPDYVYAGETYSPAYSINVTYGQQIDGITLIRYQRPLQGTDALYDISIDATHAMQIVWAIGLMKPSDGTKGNRTPQSHGSTNFSHKLLNVGRAVDDCLGPMVAQNAYQGEVVVADRGTKLVVGSDVSLHYPDPPFPRKVFYVNQKEAPLLRVERGVPVTFSVQAGHDVAFYITNNPVGGATNKSETIYAGGPEVHGVPVIPYPLMWHPNRSTPDLVYYQDYFTEKRGWQVQVVDGGLSDMYNTSATLADNKVTLFWTLTSGRIYLAVRGEVKSGYLAIAFGSGMVNSFSYVGWVDGERNGHISAYWMNGKKASSIHSTGEDLSDQKCEIVDGIITFEFSRPLQPSCSKGTLCRNVIDPRSLLKVVWALGDAWTSDALADNNMHTDVSTRPTLIHLLSGAAKVEQLQPVLAVHGFMMFVAWGLLLPVGVLGARYLKHLSSNGWFEIHMYSQLSGIVIMLLGLLFAVAELHGFNTRTTHMKVGLLSMFLALWQSGNGYLRPKDTSPGEPQPHKRVVWRYVHIYSGRSALFLGFVSLVTGISQLARRDGVEHMKGLQWALFVWFLFVASVVGYIEVQGFWRKKGRDKIAFDRILGTEDDPQDVWARSRGPFFSGESKVMQPSPARGLEIQLEPLM